MESKLPVKCLATGPRSNGESCANWPQGIAAMWPTHDRIGNCSYTNNNIALLCMGTDAKPNKVLAKSLPVKYGELGREGAVFVSGFKVLGFNASFLAQSIAVLTSEVHCVPASNYRRRPSLAN